MGGVYSVLVIHYMAEEDTKVEDESKLDTVIERLDRLAEVLGTRGIETAKNAGEVQDPMSIHVMDVMLRNHELVLNAALEEAKAKNIIQNALLARLVGEPVQQQ